MLISWGPEYTMLYNDAYGVVVGNKHPGALGRSCREVLAEALDFIGPRFTRSLRRVSRLAPRPISCSRSTDCAKTAFF